MSKAIVKISTGFYSTVLILLLSAGPLSAEPAENKENQNATEPQTLYQNYACASCHGERGQNPLPGMPMLGGQDKTYLINQLKDFKSGARTNGRSQTMIGYLTTMADDEMMILADWLSLQ